MAIQMDFTKFNDEELVDLNARLVEHMKLRHQARSQMALAKYHAGDRVQFKNLQGKIVKGTIIRINRKTITLHSDDHLNWKVSPSLLQKISEEKSNPGKRNNLFHFPS